MSRFAKFCSVCRDAGKPLEVYTSHFVKDQPGPNGKVVCPTLLSQPCRYCKESGHTVKYCPKLDNKPKNFFQNQNRKITTRIYEVDTEEELMKPTPPQSPKKDTIINMPYIPITYAYVSNLNTNTTTTNTTVMSSMPSMRSTTTTDVIINMPSIPSSIQKKTYADIIREKVKIEKPQETSEKTEIQEKPNNDILLKLQKQIELLKKENQDLKKENEELKMKEKPVTPYKDVFPKFLNIENFNWADEMEKEDIEETKSEEIKTEEYEDKLKICIPDDDVVRQFHQKKRMMKLKLEYMV